MNINFEEFSSERDMLEHIKSVIPEDYDEVYTAKHHYTDGEFYMFYDDYDLEEWMKDYVTQNAEDPESELTRWSFTQYEIKQDKLARRRVMIECEYSLELTTVTCFDEDWEGLKDAE